jgi:hypothetical protein
MSARLADRSTTVPIADGTDVRIEPGQPYPSPYRGSRYSIVDSRRNGTVLEWKYKDLVVHVDPPAELLDSLHHLGKSRGSGRGSIRVTADRSVLTKIHTDSYRFSQEAPVDSGWIPVYLGKLEGDLGFDIDNDPSVPDRDHWVWGGFSFNHGERWSVSDDDRLIWTWQDYRFHSALDHDDLIAKYARYRQIAGRLYVNEHGHVFVNVPRDEVPPSEADTVDRVYEEWRHHVDANDDRAAKRLVQRRLKVTGDGDPSDGHLPLYIGHLSEFDEGAVPKPVVTDETYYVEASRRESGRY